MGYKLSENIKLSVLAEANGLSWSGVDVEISMVSSLSSAVSGCLSYSSKVASYDNGIAVITSFFDGPVTSFGCIFSETPRLDFIRILDFLNKNIGFKTWDFPPEIDQTASIGRNVVIEDGCIIGANSIIEHNVVLHAGTRIGANSRIRSSSSIGGDGFGFERLSNGNPIRFPHLGGVLIGDNVEVGACTTIARGTLSDTIIEDYVKVDNLVHIAHNCLIKKGAFIIACAELSGGVIVGENAWVAPNSCTHQKISIGAESIIGLGSVVTKDVPSRTVFAGNPAKKLRDF